MDDLARLLEDAAASRRLPLPLRERLEEIFLEKAALIEEPLLKGIDGPRTLPPGFINRLEQAMLQADHRKTRRGALPGKFRRKLKVSLPLSGPPFPRGLIATLAVASVVLLIANMTVLVAGQRPSATPVAIASPEPSPSPSPSPLASVAPAPSEPLPLPPGSLESFPTAYQFLRYVRAEALKLAGPYEIRHPSIGRSFGGTTTSAQSRRAATTSQNSGAGGPGSTGGSEAGTGSEASGVSEFSDASSAAGGQTGQFSTTNVQEEGVDEPDIVKNDGNRIAVMSGAKVSVLQFTRNQLVLKSSVDAPNENGIGLFLIGDRLIRLSSITKQAHPTQSSSFPDFGRTWTKVTVIDISRLSNPKVVSSVEVEGSYVGARLAAGVVRLILQSAALGPSLNQPTDYSQESLNAATEANKAAIQRSVVGHWLPHYVFERPGRRAQTGHVHDWNAISKPPDRSGVSMITVLTIDPADPKPNNATSVIGSGDIIYASLNNLYVTSNRLDDVIQIEQGGFPQKPYTRIHKFDITDPNIARYVASGEVPGFLLNQFSLSEKDGLLRVATTLGFTWMPPQQGISESFVTVLGEKDRKLVPIGSVGGIGKGERIYSVRFIGSLGYVVTFRQTDPLHVIDLSNPEHPELKGELKVPGYSGYLHPLSATLLLGIGRSADESGRLQGVQLSLFDISDSANPKLLHQRAEGEYGYSSVEQDHHGFLYWDPKNLAVFPASISSQSDYFSGALAVKVKSDSGFGDPVRLSHVGRPGSEGYLDQISRSIVIGTNLLTVSGVGVLVSDLNSFAERSWVPLAH